MIEVKRKETDITDEELKIRQLKANLEDYDSWGYKHYPMPKDEADTVLKLIEERGD